MDSWVCSLNCQWWRENWIRFDSVRSRYITAAYRIIWFEVEVLQNRTFSSAQKIITFMTYMATCFDYYVIIIRQLQLFLIVWKLIVSISSPLNTLETNKYFLWWIRPRIICKNWIVQNENWERYLLPLLSCLQIFIWSSFLNYSASLKSTNV